MEEAHGQCGPFHGKKTATRVVAKHGLVYNKRRSRGLGRRCRQPAAHRHDGDEGTVLYSLVPLHSRCRIARPLSAPEHNCFWKSIFSVHIGAIAFLVPGSLRAIYRLEFPGTIFQGSMV